MNHGSFRALPRSLVACLIGAAACGGGALPPPGDGAVEAAPQVSMTCALATQSPCAAAEQCSPFCDGQVLVVACRAEPTAPAKLGEACSGMICERGTTCLTTAAMPAQCVKLCAATADCPGTKGCRTINVTYPCVGSGGQNVVTLHGCL